MTQFTGKGALVRGSYLELKMALGTRRPGLERSAPLSWVCAVPRRDLVKGTNDLSTSLPRPLIHSCFFSKSVQNLLCLV